MDVHEMWEQEAARERERHKLIREALDEAAALVDPYDWGLGDGEGGALMSWWRYALDANGVIPTDRPARPGPKPRKPTSRAVQLAVYRRDSFTCKICATPGGDLTVDHIIPVSAGGSDEMDNLQTACRSCNSSKGDR